MTCSTVALTTEAQDGLRLAVAGATAGILAVKK